MTTRGIRNNNPGNLRKSKDKWQGRASEQPDKDFFTFKDPIYGIRALAIVLIGYQDKYGLQTIDQIITRFAPPNENNTKAYIRAVYKDMGFSLGTFVVNLHKFEILAPLVKAIIHHENGVQPYTDAQITKALVLAGVEPDKAPITQSRTVKAGQAVTAATVSLSGVEGFQQNIDTAKDSLMQITPYVDCAKWILLGVILLGVGVMLWARIDDHMKGLR